MSITSLIYFLFISVSVLIYYITPQKVRQWVLLAASAFFYIYSCGFSLFVIMCLLVAFAYKMGLVMEAKPQYKSVVTASAVVVLVAVLILYKDLTFFIENAKIISGLFGMDEIFGIELIDLAAPDWAAPLGISYFTLMLIGYIADINWGKITAEKNPLKVLLFTCYFPQMVLGPFTRYGEMKDELFTGHKFDYENFTFGVQRVMWGCFKKLIIAERLAIIVKSVYSNYEALGGGFVLIGALAYVGQLYTDFSSAMDIIIGVSQMFGVVLPENFRQPFHSRSLSEIWRRWHITLGLWLKDYVMYPVQKAFTTKLGKLAKKKLGKKWGKDSILYLSMLVTWFCVGFWHGGSWKYICASGLFFFVMIVGGLLLQPLFDRLKKLLHINTEAWSWHLFQSVRSFLLFTFSVSFGRAASLEDGFKMWGLAFTNIPQNIIDFLSAWTGKSLYSAIGLNLHELQILFISLLLLLLVSTLQLKTGIRKRIARQNLVYRWALYLLVFAATLVYGLYGAGYNPTDFIYAGF